jgi:predicted nucleic acid-binding protein
MNAVDTNVLVYRLDRGDPVKQAIARDLLRRLAKDTEPTVLPWQVLSELVCQLRRWQDEGKLARVFWNMPTTGVGMAPGFPQQQLISR